MKKKASNPQKKVSISFRRKLTILYYRGILTTKLLALVFLGVLFFTNYLDFVKQEIAQSFYEISGDLGFKLEKVVIAGNKNISQGEVRSALNADTGTPIFSIDLKNIKKQIEENTWVKQVAIKRHLPNTIYIAIMEKTPIAIWQINQQIFLIDEDGNKITSSNIDKFPKLLHVVGIGANLYASALIDELANYEELSKKIISAVRYGERRWNLNLQHNITVKMPEIGFDKAIEYLNNLDNMDKLMNQNYKVIDLRDPTKYYIEYTR
jgi:cell division protein FtsQ